jgi:uncharacterized protein (DUF2236 family)
VQTGWVSGYFAPDSMVVRALGTRAVALTYGQRALVTGALHPRLFVGTAQHTTHRQTPYTRLGLTARLFEAVFLGDKAEADRALSFAAKRHTMVRGQMETDGGPAHPRGAPYSAADPGLMWWTAAFTLDSVEHMHDLLVRRLRDDERQELFEGFVRWAELFGMPRDAAPASYDEFRTTFDAWLASDEPWPVDEARLVARHIAGMSGYGLPLRPLSSPALATVVQGSLSPRVRDFFDIGWGLQDELRFQGIVRASRLAHGRLSLVRKSPILRGRSEAFYKVVAHGEQARVRRGGVSIPGVSDAI